jgi:two-component system chemotaxis response regulator CheB
MVEPPLPGKGTTTLGKIKVLIVEDSPTISRLLAKLFSADPALEVIGLANDGTEAIRMTGRLRPNVITMDVHMPNMDGLEATEYIMAHYPTPILVLTASLGKHDVDLSFKMLSAGALEIVEKPPADEWEAAGRRLVERIKLLSRIKVITHIRAKSRSVNPSVAETLTPPPAPVHPITTRNNRPANTDHKPTAKLNPSKLIEIEQRYMGSPILNGELKGREFNIVCIAASTGGPPALSKLLRALPNNFPVPLLVVQHIPAGFSVGLADWLNGETPLQVKNAVQGETPLPGFVYLPGDDRHLVVRTDGKLYHSDEPPRLGLRPSADVTFESLAMAWPGKILSIILTGMGRDGTLGMKALHKAGGYNVAQDEASSVIFGMPKSAIDAQVVDKVLPINEIANFLKSVFL